MDDLLAQFVIEAAELTQQAAEDLLALDREPGNRAKLDSAFRAIHTLKGSVGLFDLAPMQGALHAAEDVLGLAIKDNVELDPARIDPILAVIEWIDRCVQHLQRAATLPPEAADEAAKLVLSLASGRAAPVASSLAGATVPHWAAGLFEAHPALQRGKAVALRYSPAPECFFNGDDPVSLMAAVPDLVFTRVSTREDWPDPTEFDPFRSNLIFEAISTAKRAEIEAVFRLIPDQIAIAQDASPDPKELPAESGETVMRTIRVDLARIDDIVALVGELLTAKNGMSALVAQAQALEGGLALSRNVAAAQQDLGRLVNQLQRAATDVRMVPLGDTLRRLSRLVREISGQTGKPLQLDVTGGEIEADKTIVDGLYEPMLHIIRNAVDHGIETEEQRQIAGKPAKGTISVDARQVGHRIELELRDDGRGIEPGHIRAAALARGLISAETAATLGESESLELLFTPGFSTSETVSNLSGRGVGMDAVRASVRRLGGKVTIVSAVGTGTTIGLSLPTSFAMSRVILVTVAGEQYGVPMDSITETVRIPASAITQVRSSEVCVLRDRTIPILRLGDIVGSTVQTRSEELLLVLEIGASALGLVVDSIGERFETLLRPPAGLLKAVKGILGTTVLGDGRIVMVLDLEALLA
ncbi:chemotaxis protein CheA [Bosea sp. BK604]|uniref:chemotaxis protein CheA n=1 Tax=Bosea sp. BK604 TaxID=2512180 RepID=UPI0010481EFE|nr:chemotaxis protein CheA [Bosea sp. BK604]TCR65691.1 two-component system chemotaxis sensor kinase CheA [Bosea sp. BK604]